MSEASNNGSIVAGTLAEEHGFLGAALEPDANGRLTPAYYGDAQGEPEAFDRGCALADVSGLVGACIGGAPATALASMVFSAPTPLPGSIAPALALAGDGSIVSFALLAGTGQNDYAFWAPAETAVGLRTWVEGIAAINENGNAPFDGAEVTDAASCTTLALCGPAAVSVLGDYLSQGAALPAPGAIENLMLDAIPCVAACLEVGGDLWYLLWVPDAKARALWRSLLSFEAVTPVGTSAVWGRVALTAPGLVDFLDMPEKPVKPKEAGLEKLLRPQGGFIGARALSDEPETPHAR